jgi:hypothetical protein
MFEKIWVGGLVAALALSATAASAKAPSDHDHDHHGATGASLQLNGGKKWQTDAVMKANMEALRNDLAASIDAIHHRKFKPEEYRKLAATIESRVTKIISECKLEPEVDAQFHLLLPELFGGVNAMKGEGDQRAGAVRILRALDSYAEYFEHPGWKPIAH